MTEPQTCTQDADRRPLSARAANLRTLLLLLTCALPVCYAAGRFTHTGSNAPMEPGARALHRVDLNSAGLYELLLLESVGEATARKIIDDRNATGPFAAVDDLQRVKGIGPKTIEKLRPNVRVGPE